MSDLVRRRWLEFGDEFGEGLSGANRHLHRSDSLERNAR
jgi:hypothetical protein